MNLFDAFIVMISLIEVFFLTGNSTFSAFRAVRIFRVFRVLRVTKIVRSLEYMKLISTVTFKVYLCFCIKSFYIGYFNSLNSFIYICLLLLLFIFVYTLLGK